MEIWVLVGIIAVMLAIVVYLEFKKPPPPPPSSNNTNAIAALVGAVGSIVALV
jgi:hypothetical protein